MKQHIFLTGTCGALLLGFSQHLAGQTFENGDFVDGPAGWNISFLKELEPEVNVVADGFEGKSVLTIAVPETDIAAWNGRMTQDIELPEEGSYTVSFFGKADPAEVDISMAVLGTTPEDSKPFGHQALFKLSPDWKEYSFKFSNEGRAKVAIMWANLARSVTTFSFAKMRITKE